MAGESLKCCHILITYISINFRGRMAWNFVCTVFIVPIRVAYKVSRAHSKYLHYVYTYRKLIDKALSVIWRIKIKKERILYFLCNHCITLNANALSVRLRAGFRCDD